MSKLNNFKWKYVADASFEGKYDMPVLKLAEHMPRNLTGFHMARTTKHPENKWFHFYEDDYQFDRLWKCPDRYLSMLKKFEGGISPDYSIYLDMPRSQQIWNCWRNRVMAYWMQTNGLNIIPNVGWSDESSLEWAFDGIPEKSILAITTQGCIRDEVSKQSLLNGLHELVRRKHPTKICVYGQFPDIWKERFPVPIVTFRTFSEERWRA